MTTPDAPPAGEPEFLITRVFAAPRQRMWETWTRPEHLARWFGPKGVSTVVQSHELRPGGMLHYRMDMPNGGRMWGRSVYREINEPSRLVWINSFSDEQANITRAPFFNGRWPLEMLTTVSFEEEAAETRVTLRWMPINATTEERETFASNMASMNQGWTGSFDQLDQFLRRAG